MNIYLRKVASEGINHHVEHCIFVPASRVLFSSRCPTFRVSLLSSLSVRNSPSSRTIAPDDLESGVYLFTIHLPPICLLLPPFRNRIPARRARARAGRVDAVMFWYVSGVVHPVLQEVAQSKRRARGSP